MDKCLLCGAEFLPMFSGKKKVYCSKFCGRKHWRKLNPEMEKAQQKRCVENRKNDPERYALWQKKASIKGQTQRGRFTKYKAQAKSRNYPFELDEDQFLSFWEKPCHYCGDKIDGIGIDRIDNSLGYTIENCVPCCEDCNRMKMTKTIEQFLRKCEIIVSRTATIRA
jgi:hypothetical protein